MNAPTASARVPSYSDRAALVCLALVIGVQCWGYADWSLRGETPLYGLIYFDWDWSESAVNRIDEWSIVALRTGAFLLPLATLLVAGFRFTRVRGLVVALIAFMCLATSTWTLAMAGAKWWRDTPFYPTVSWGSWEVRLVEVGVIIEQSVRYVAPLVMILLLPCCGTVSNARYQSAIWLLRLAAATTFFGHGYEALRGNPQFVDLLVTSSKLQLGYALDEALARQLVWLIGVQDLLLAALILVPRWRGVAIYMAIWAAITAASRITHSGWEAYPETLIRVANAGVPLALSLLQSHSRRNVE